MGTIPFIEYIKELIKQAHRYQNTKISTGECLCQNINLEFINGVSL